MNLINPGDDLSTSEIRYVFITFKMLMDIFGYTMRCLFWILKLMLNVCLLALTSQETCMDYCCDT